MGKVLEELTDKEIKFIASQKVFFVATAPLSGSHHISVSPKSPGTSIAVLDPHTVAYADLTGSGAETAAHVLQNQRMTILFVNLEEGPPKILRLHGMAKVIPAQKVDQSLSRHFPSHIMQSFGFRAVFVLHVTRISTSCGYSMPIMTFQKYRNTLEEYTAREGQEGMLQYCTKKNSFSVDGLPSIALIRHYENDIDIIEPYHEDGFVYGRKITSDSKDESNDNDVTLFSKWRTNWSCNIFSSLNNIFAPFQYQSAQHFHSHSSGKIITRTAIFVAGAVFGSVVSTTLSK